MEAKDYLEKIAAMDVNVDVVLEEVARLDALSKKITATTEGIRVKASGSQQKMADCRNKIVDAINEMKQAIDARTEYEKNAMKLIQENCEPDCMKLLHKRYFIGEAWDTIARDMHFSVKWVSGGLHAKALEQVQKALDRENEWKG